MKNYHQKSLWNKWHHVWILTRQYERKLKDHQANLIELEKIKSFDWDEWRKRFLRHHQYKKFRVVDMLRRLDRNDEGFLTRETFINGLLRNRLKSSPLEINEVANRFDQGNGLVDWRDFLSALKPEWQEPLPFTEADRIYDEINRQVSMCTCKQKFKVFQVGEGKYRVSYIHYKTKNSPSRTIYIHD